MTKTMAAAAALVALTACSKGGDNAASPAANVANVAAAAPRPGQDWTQTVTTTPAGGFVMGDPGAPIKLVEYGSLSCSHCAEFSEVGAGPLKNYVRSGKVSWEFRNYVRDPMDVTASLIARCNGAATFFPMTEALYADQKNWFAKLQAEQQQLKGLENKPPAQQFDTLANFLELYQFAAQRGLPEAKAKACVADKAATDQLVKMVDEANKTGMQGTPTFLINGKIVPNVATWPTLEPALKAAGA